MSPLPILEGLPCRDAVRKGIQDLKDSRTSQEACLASMCSPRLQRPGLLSADIKIIPEAETLYGLLRSVPGNAYGRYNALGSELVSVEHRLDARMKHSERSLPPQ